MSNAQECKVCGGYLSDIHSAFMRGDPCPNCGAREEDSLLLERIETLRESYKKKSLDSEIAEKNLRLETELAHIKVKFSAIERDMWTLISSAEEHATQMGDLRSRMDSLYELLDNK